MIFVAFKVYLPLNPHSFCVAKHFVWNIGIDSTGVCLACEFSVQHCWSVLALHLAQGHSK